MLILLFLACSDCQERTLGSRAFWVVGDELEWADAPPYSRRAVVDGDGVLWTQGATVTRAGQDVLTLTGESQDLAVIDGRATFLQRSDEGQLRLHYPADATPEDVPAESRSYAGAIWGDADALYLLRNGEPGGTYLRALQDNTWQEDVEVAVGLPERNWLVLGPRPSWARTEALDFVFETLEGGAVVELGVLSGVDQIRGIVMDEQGQRIARVGIGSAQDAWVANPETGCTAQLDELVAPFALQGVEEGALALGFSPDGALLSIPVSADCSIGSPSEVNAPLDATFYGVAAASDGPTPLVVGEWVATDGETFTHTHPELCL